MRGKVAWKNYASLESANVFPTQPSLTSRLIGSRPVFQKKSFPWQSWDQEKWISRGTSPLVKKLNSPVLPTSDRFYAKDVFIWCEWRLPGKWYRYISRERLTIIAGRSSFPCSSQLKLESSRENFQVHEMLLFLTRTARTCARRACPRRRGGSRGASGRTGCRGSCPSTRRNRCRLTPSLENRN